MGTIDINSDLGESFGNWRMGNDDGLIPEITSANIACGFHASDPLTMICTVKLCKQHGVEAGSHPGQPDLLDFGRRVMSITPEDCYAYVLYQAGALQAVLARAGRGSLLLVASNARLRGVHTVRIDENLPLLPPQRSDPSTRAHSGEVAARPLTAG